jgi:hypothetical protein
MQSYRIAFAKKVTEKEKVAAQRLFTAPHAGGDRIGEADD